MNVCLNGNLAQMPGIHFDVLLTPKKNATLPLTLKLFCFISFGWLVGLGFNGPLRQYFSLYRAVSQREGERGKKG